MTAAALVFTAPGAVTVEQLARPAPGPDQLLVQTRVSAISAGTELLIYRGQMPAGLAADATIPALATPLTYPLRYGYAAVGRVVAVGDGVDAAWLDRMVFSFQPHATHFVARPAEVMPLPAGLDPDTAAFLPNMETAVSFLMDGQPMIGEQVAVFGQGVVGLLTTGLLAGLPLASLITLDQYPLRREWSRRLGAHASLAPADPSLAQRLQGDSPYAGADLVYELSGHPRALDQAVAAAGYHGRIVIGSWYGQKRVELDLGGRFHRSHMRLISSQVSHIAPPWRGRWQPARRLQTAWRALARLQPARLVTHRFPLADAAAAYGLLDQEPAQVLQVLLTY